jgi:hypothetical protein
MARLLLSGFWSFSKEEGKMSMLFADRELQARLLRETHELYERRLKLESAIRAADAASKLHLEKAALRDIEAYRHFQRLHLSHAHEIRKLSGALLLAPPRLSYNPDR